MALVAKLILYFHLIGVSMVLGGLLMQIKAEEKKVFPGMIHGILTIGVTGLILAGLKGADLNTAKILTKLILFAAVFGLVNKQKQQALLPGQYNLLIGLTLLTVAVAVFW
jgi:hypothetical protein